MKTPSLTPAHIWQRLRNWFWRWQIILWDALAVTAAFAAVFQTRFRLGWGDQTVDIVGRVQASEYATPALIVTGCWLALFSLFGLYRRRIPPPRPASELARVFYAITLGVLLLALVTFDPSQPFAGSRITIVIYMLILSALVAGGRLLSAAPLPAQTAGNRKGGIIRRRYLVVVADVVIFAGSYYLAFWLRFDGAIPDDALDAFKNTLPFLLLIRFAMFLWFRVYAGIWRYASVNDLLSILKAVAAGTAFLVLPIYFFDITGYPRSIFLIDSVLLVLLAGGSRFALRGLREFAPLLKRVSSAQRVLIIGAGDAGEILLRELKRDAAGEYRPVGFVDDDTGKRGLRVHGLPVLGTVAELSAHVARTQAVLAFIAVPSATGAQMRRIVTACSRARIAFKTVPPLKEILAGHTVGELRQVKVDDLLGREPVVLDDSSMARFLEDRRIMITGAAGSIGSELARQIGRFRPAAVVLLDRSENGLHDLIDELSYRDLPTKYEAVLADLRDQRRFHAQMGDRPPDVIFHAAAYKQVPLMEAHPDSAVLNNVGVSRFLMDWALERGVASFVNISTDKAVRPRSVMGATKRIAEILAVQRAADARTKLVNVRFGNVLGSMGSVVPLFTRQIERGGPVTVTHPDITRYFMTISEAALLVLQAAAIGRNGELLVLDMGEPVPIVDLARDMIALSGLTPDVDVKIEFSGLRSGEKLTEELFDVDDAVRRSEHNQIWIVQPTARIPHAFETRVNELLETAQEGDRATTRAMIAEIVPEYEPMTQQDATAIPASNPGDGIDPS